jgi:hypothetical protein
VATGIIATVNGTAVSVSYTPGSNGRVRVVMGGPSCAFSINSVLVAGTVGASTFVAPSQIDFYVAANTPYTFLCTGNIVISAIEEAS